MKLNNKGISIIEVIVTFSLIMVIIIGMFNIILNYQEKASLSLKKNDLITFKTTLTRDIQKDLLKYGVKEINTNGDCTTLLSSSLSECINIVFKNDQQKAFGIGKIDINNKSTIEKKYLYYDGIKYPLKDKLPSVIPEGRDILAFQSIQIANKNILTKSSTILEDGTTVNIYSIDVYISQSDFDEDFGIHIIVPDSVLSLCDFNVGHTWDFDFIRDIQEFVIPCSGTYKLEVWGAQGGNSVTRAGGYGGYSYGNITSLQNNILYIGVGGQGESCDTCVKNLGGYNGGGDSNDFYNNGSGIANYGVANTAGGGGGATHIATTNRGVLANYNSYRDEVLIVAGGGGGSDQNSRNKPFGGGEYYGIGGAGGGFKGGKSYITNYTNCNSYNATTGVCGSTSTTYIQNNKATGSQPTQSAGNSFGQGANNAGGGWFGGYYNLIDVNSGLNDIRTGSGGSGYIGNITLSNKGMYCYNCDTSSQASTKTTSTNKALQVPTANTAKIGNGYARITLVSY